MKVNTILDDKTKYVKLGATDTGDPAVKIEIASKLKLRKWIAKGYSHEDVYDTIDRLTKFRSEFQKLYALPKTHIKVYFVDLF